MKIKEISTFIMHVPVTNDLIGDSTHSITHWGMPGVMIKTECGLVGYGHTGTHADITTDRLITTIIEDVFGPMLLGEDPTEVRYLHRKLTRSSTNIWVGRGGLMQMAISAIDIALWDLKAKAADQPLWQLFGGSKHNKVNAYNTDCGWLVRSQDDLVDDCKKMIFEEGFKAIKMKIGKPDPREDLQRIEAVRHAIGDDIDLMVDANGKWDISIAKQYGHRLNDFNIKWFEEPLWHDDVASHKQLAAYMDTPIALGELLYHNDSFKEFVLAGAVDYLQPDATRCGGLTAVWEIADLGMAFNLPVTPHHGDMMQAQLHLVMAHPACSLLEFIPWTLDCFVDPVEVIDGVYTTPTAPGAGTTLKPEALAKFNVK
ncbi:MULTISPECIES: mandelate racemase/muconate lactonizing enzyme family protein [Providencia]|uniref:Mandelate racemase/muconate lactonizing enzyme family protein n=2 Tax=Providencia TaxID=586 RepID=A0AA42JX41_9GAMM|nr:MULTISPECIES: mandelate racemase/muconate lactonizing enzyme family protein [Providencia]EIL1983301.1 mandelate racemase/muconate lactonizing enzyme family protein [Providencia rettgeri]EIU9514489.1 mandelate racemase/muconate lactonizing enzyme family protein [Providencia rettgeri]EJD6042039.1 mandelate racemase/muconate lactonizing enzyme family protein [Providencia rettgeri]EJD6080250.1 mandelate racemase/muconate lactonizing enzyme family protein [Providencia rettgeri]EJD6369742.1 mande